jgi:hypothetical protein
MNILMIAFEAGRWGSARLVKPLAAAGFEVAVLCPADNPLAATRFIARHFPLDDVHSSRRFEAQLAEIMLAWRPMLVIPADESTVACLHAVLRQPPSRAPGRLSQDALNVLRASFGHPDCYDATLLKSETLRLARHLGLPIPAGGSVASVGQAVAEAERIGFPVYVKTSFSWSGNGVTRCLSGGDVTAAFAAAAGKRRLPFRNALRRLVHRDWYPIHTTTDVQQAIAGTPAMFCAVAVNGRMVAGFAGIAHQTCAPNGPSSIAWIGAHPEMERISAEMIRGVAANGFISFDFMIEDRTGAVYLLECNPRPIPISHLGARIGVDLCAALAAALSGDVRSATRSAGAQVVVLFPQEWHRNPSGVASSSYYVDVPRDDPNLLRLMFEYAPAAPRARRLTAAFQVLRFWVREARSRLPLLSHAFPVAHGIGGRD